MLALALAGCVAFFPSRDPFSATVGVRLDVENQNFYDAMLYVISDLRGTERRIGAVSGNDTETFRVPWESSASMSIRIELLAGASCTTAPIVVNPGDELELQILPDFLRSAFCS